MKSPIIFQAFLWLSVRFKIPVTSADGLSADRFLAPSLPLPSPIIYQRAILTLEKRRRLNGGLKSTKAGVYGSRLPPSFFSQSVTHPANKPAEEVPALCLSQGRRRRRSRTDGMNAIPAAAAAPFVSETGAAFFWEAGVEVKLGTNHIGCPRFVGGW